MIWGKLWRRKKLTKVYWHIGFGKTGSSALQSSLSLDGRSVKNQLGENLLYCSIQSDGRILSGRRLMKLAANSPQQYIASDPEIADRNITENLRRSLKKIFNAGYTPVFSQEDWGRRGYDFIGKQFFEKLGCAPHVIVYVRPQVSWFNSGWWQWFAWVDQFSTPHEVVSAWGGYDFMRWAAQIEPWRQLAGNSNISVRLHSQDVLADFLSVLKVTKEWGRAGVRANVSLSPTVLKLFKKFPDLRRVDRPDVDFILSGVLKFEGCPPWVIDPDFARQIVEETRLDNLRLLELLDAESRGLMQNDLGWWDAEYYRNRKVWSGNDYELTREESDEALHQALLQLIEIGRAR
jgi:hypothetical protein